MSDPKHVLDFIKQVYPEKTELCMAVNNEETLLTDATKLIVELKQAVRELVVALKKYQEVKINRNGDNLVAIHYARELTDNVFKNNTTIRRIMQEAKNDGM